METGIKLSRLTRVSIALWLLVFGTGLSAQNRHLVWADEFDGAAVDQTRWRFETGPTAETLHYFTDHAKNAKIADGMLQIIALEESYEGFNYTAALLKTHDIFYWRYGRIEARMKLPHTTGFVPGFWMLPQDDQYGFWPWGGEIDIMEHPTNQNKIYGTCHNWQYSYFTGSMQPAGGNIPIADSETAFHIYAVEWTADKIDFFVDDQKYYTYNNAHNGFEAWPFDQPFYILLAMGVGGGWVGPPDATTVFPGVLEVDYVRVYQNIGDLVISGADDVLSNSKGVVYTVPQIDGAVYSWNVPNGAAIVSGDNTHQIGIDWGIFGGNVTVEVNTGDGAGLIEFPVVVSANLMKNAGFEDGVKYWNKTSYPADAVFVLTSEDVHSGLYAMFADVRTPGVNAWDAQLSQGNLTLKTGKNYHASFWAKKEGAPAELGPAILNSTNYTVYALETITVTDTWQQFEFDFQAPANVTASLNIGMGGQTGKFYYDDFMLTETGSVDNSNQIVNADFSAGDTDWIFNTFAPAEANAAAEEGELAVSIENGGVNTWDIFVGQTGVSIENGLEYVVSFDAYAAAPRDIFAFTGKNADPWNVYSGQNTISLTTRRQTYTYSFIMNDPADNQARLGFDLGASSADVFLDNVFLSKGSTPVRVNWKGPVAFSLSQNTPNPFNPTTWIRFELPERTRVKLEIYDVSGRRIASLMESAADAGSHAVSWDGGDFASGIYFCRLTAGSMSQIRKMTLIK